MKIQTIEQIKEREEARKKAKEKALEEAKKNPLYGKPLL